MRHVAYPVSAIMFSSGGVGQKKIEKMYLREGNVLRAAPIRFHHL
jgi:hypothetical protein